MDPERYIGLLSGGPHHLVDVQKKLWGPFWQPALQKTNLSQDKWPGLRAESKELADSSPSHGDLRRREWMAQVLPGLWRYLDALEIVEVRLLT